MEWPKEVIQLRTECFLRAELKPIVLANQYFVRYSSRDYHTCICQSPLDSWGLTSEYLKEDRDKKFDPTWDTRISWVDFRYAQFRGMLNQGFCPLAAELMAPWGRPKFSVELGSSAGVYGSAFLHSRKSRSAANLFLGLLASKYLHLFRDEMYDVLQVQRRLEEGRIREREQSEKKIAKRLRQLKRP